mmetsp:Transcript_17636/g.40725  ORF Transcript_17636/g.40725 Transcript_17636/m.40725 type:complete len:351 (-) Transcript_17636:1028-2080(-)
MGSRHVHGGPRARGPHVLLRRPLLLLCAYCMDRRRQPHLRCAREAGCCGSFGAVLLVDQKLDHQAHPPSQLQRIRSPPTLLIVVESVVENVVHDLHHLLHEGLLDTVSVRLEHIFKVVLCQHHASDHLHSVEAGMLHALVQAIVRLPKQCIGPEEFICAQNADNVAVSIIHPHGPIDNDKHPISLLVPGRNEHPPLKRLGRHGLPEVKEELLFVNALHEEEDGVGPELAPVKDLEKIPLERLGDRLDDKVSVLVRQLHPHVIVCPLHDASHRADVCALFPQIVDNLLQGICLVPRVPPEVGDGRVDLGEHGAEDKGAHVHDKRHKQPLAAVDGVNLPEPNGGEDGVDEVV